MSCEDGIATAGSDSSIDCILINWTQGAPDGSADLQVRREATELMESVRSRNARLPIFLMANRKIAGTVSVEIAQLANEFIWILGGHRHRSSPAASRPRSIVTARNCCRPTRGRWLPTTATPSTPGRRPVTRAASPSSSRPSGRVFFDFYGENLFRTDMGIERGALGSLLGHSGPVGESERYAARVFGAHRSYTVLNGTSASNRTIMTACVGDGEIALCDRNCHKSIEQGLALTGGIPVFITPTRNRYGIIGPASPASLEPAAINAAIAANPLAKNAANKKPVYAVLTNCTYDGMCYDSAQVESAPRRKAATACISTRPGMGTRASIPLYENRFAMRDDPASHPKDGPTVFATHSTHKLLAALSQTSWIHIRDGKGAIDHGRFNEAYCTQASTSPLYLLIASNDVAAAMMDGPGGHALTQETIDEAVACRLATARVHQEFKAQQRLVLRAVECAGDQGREERQEGPVPRGLARTARHRPGVLGAASGREVARLRRHPRRLVHARSDQVRHRLPRHAGRRQARRARHPGRHRHRLYRRPRDRAIAHHRSHGAVPVLRGHHQGQVGHAAEYAARLQEATTTAMRR